MRAWSGSVAVAAFVLLAGCANAPARGIPVDERFAPCPDSPNCVSSYASDDLHAIDPLPLTASDPLRVVREIVEALPRTQIVTVDDDYLHATFASRVFGFVDDVEFRVDAAAGVIQVRSASRVGYGDMGVNRRRVEDLRQRLAAHRETP
jgi:uncharacterized protein (DUF1499 family)